MLVFLVRHGESVTNRESKWTGWLDSKLSEKGYEDAEKAGKYLRQFTFDKVYSSDLTRANETGKTALCECDIEKKEILREICVGILAGNSISMIEEEERKVLLIEGFKKYEGESKDEFRDRIRAFMRETEKLSDTCEKVIAFTHGGFIQEMRDLVVGIKVPRAAFPCKNCATAVFEYNDGKWSLHSWINLI